MTGSFSGEFTTKAELTPGAKMTKEIVEALRAAGRTDIAETLEKETSNSIGKSSLELLFSICPTANIMVSVAMTIAGALIGQATLSLPPDRRAKLVDGELAALRNIIFDHVAANEEGA